MRIDANHQFAPQGKEVRMGAAPYKGAPISTTREPARETDLLGHEIRPAKHGNGKPEAAALVEFLPSLCANE